MTQFTPKDLPYSADALEPHVSAQTFSFHHGKHYKTYITKLNGLIEGTDFAGKSLEEIVKTSSAGIFNNAAQVWNHEFYFNSMSPDGGGAPSGAVAARIDATFGSFDAFKEKFNNAGATLFGSGWVWLVSKGDALEIVSTPNADTPLKSGEGTALLTCDVWEHAYYLDYQNARPKYLDSWWNVVNWAFANENLG